MTSHLSRLLKKAEALACQCEPTIGYSCNVHQMFEAIRQEIHSPQPEPTAPAQETK